MAGGILVNGSRVVCEEIIFVPYESVTYEFFQLNMSAFSARSHLSEP